MCGIQIKAKRDLEKEKGREGKLIFPPDSSDCLVMKYIQKS